MSQNDPEFRKAVDAIQVVQHSPPLLIRPDRLNRLGETMWMYEFQISVGSISFQVPIFVPDSVPADKRDEDAVEALKFFANALAQKISEAF